MVSRKVVCVGSFHEVSNCLDLNELIHHVVVIAAAAMPKGVWWGPQTGKEDLCTFVSRSWKYFRDSSRCLSSLESECWPCCAGPSTTGNSIAHNSAPWKTCQQMLLWRKRWHCMKSMNDARPFHFVCLMISRADVTSGRRSIRAVD